MISGAGKNIFCLMVCWTVVLLLDFEVELRKLVWSFVYWDASFFPYHRVPCTINIVIKWKKMWWIVWLARTLIVQSYYVLELIGIHSPGWKYLIDASVCLFDAWVFLNIEMITKIDL